MAPYDQRKKETKEEQKKDKSVYQEQTSEQLLRVIDLPAEIDSSKAPPL